MSWQGLVWTLDPSSFAEDCGVELDGWQSEVLTSTSRKLALLASRQSGKSTICALLALQTAVCTPDALVLLISPSQRQSSELFRKVLHHYRSLREPPDLNMMSAARLEFKNGSRIIALPGSGETVRGFSGAAAVIVDEAARVDEDIMAAVRPILATTMGRLVCLTTPAGPRGWFHSEWRDGLGWHRIKVTAREIPRISAEFLADERRALGELLYRQEYDVEFVDDGASVFNTAILEACLKPLGSLFPPGMNPFEHISQRR
jgi:hypothetical protein